MSAQEVAHYNAVRNADIRYLNSAPPGFWDSITDPQTRSYLQGLKSISPK
jgi:hypothetical protein